MAKQSDLFDTLRARGLRKRVAATVADAVEGGRKRAKDPQKTVREVLADLRRASKEIEDRATGGPAQPKAAAAKKSPTTGQSSAAKRSAAAKKGAATRQSSAAKRSAAAKKGARTRAANAKRKS